MKKFSLLLAAGLVMALSSCSSKMSEEDISKKVDEAYNKEVANLGPQLDEACNQVFDVYVQNAVDSIMKAHEAADTTSTK